MTYKLETILGNMKLYTNVKDKLIHELEEDFTKRNDIVVISLNNKTYNIQKNHLITNLISWKPFVTFNEIITEDFIMDCSDMNNDKLNYQLEKIRKRLFNRDRKKLLNIALSEVIEEFGYLTVRFNKYVGNSVSLYSHAMLANRHKRFEELLLSEIDTTKDFNQIEEELNANTKELVGILKQEENCYQDYLNCGEGININQLQQFMLPVGFKPDMNGNVYPVPVKRSIIRGFKSLSDYYIDATGGRKACY